MLVLQRVHEFVWTWSTGLLSPRRSFQSWIFSAPYNAFAILRLILPRQLGGYARGTDLDINETIAVPQRQVWWKRVFWFVCDPHAGTMFAFVAALGVAIWRIARDYERGTVDPHQTARTLSFSILSIRFRLLTMASLHIRSHCFAHCRLAKSSLARIRFRSFRSFVSFHIPPCTRKRHRNWN